MDLKSSMICAPTVKPRYTNLAITQSATIPLKKVGPVKIISPEFSAELMVPLATFEAPLWPSTARGARVTYQSGGIRAVVIDERMSRSIVVEAQDVIQAATITQSVLNRLNEIELLVSSNSRFARFKDLHTQIVGNLIYLRLEIGTGDASGHNMVTQAAENLMNWLLAQYPLTYVSLSANYCSDKKVSAVNGILGRGKYVVAETLIPEALCLSLLHVSPQKLVDLHIKKNLMGSILAGGLRSANAHFANILLAFYLATGQDAANIIEGSQGFVHAETRSEGLYFSVTLPNLIVGTVGNGKDLDFARQNLEALGCLAEVESGLNSRRLAVIIAATVLCGELSLLAALCNPGELMRSHIAIERHKKSKSHA